MTLPHINLSDDKGRIIQAALELAAERSWREVSLRDIAERAGIGLVGMREHFSTKGEVLAGLARAVDDAVLAALPERMGEDTRRDMLFEIVMARFDALAPYKSALRSIRADASAEPALFKALMSSQAWMLEAAGIGAGGLDGGVRVAGLATVYASVFRTWLDDDDPGQARTMAALDRRLRRGERALAAIDDMAAKVRQMGDRVASIITGGAAGRQSRDEDGAGPSPQGTEPADGEMPRHA